MFSARADQAAGGPAGLELILGAAGVAEDVEGSACAPAGLRARWGLRLSREWRQLDRKELFGATTAGESLPQFDRYSLGVDPVDELRRSQA